LKVEKLKQNGEALEPKEKSPTLALKDFYPVNPPHAHVGIEIEEETGKYKYVVIEPSMNEGERKNLLKLKQLLREEARVPLDVLTGDGLLEYLSKRTKRCIKDLKLKIPEEAVDKYLYYLTRDFVGYGIIDVPIKDPNVEDISCDGLNIPIYVWHRQYESIPASVEFTSYDELDAFITKLAYRAGHQISVSRPIVEGTLPEGCRVHLTLSEISKRGPTFTLRKHRADPYTITDLIMLKTLSPNVAAYFWMLVENLRSIMMAGPTASGKTTLLNAISTFIRPEMKIVTIEEVRELQLQHENWIPMVSRPSYQVGVQEVSLFDLLKSSLRQRPDYIIVGEIRGEEAYTLFQSIAVGHGGMCTIHADSVDSAVKRLITRPMDIPRLLIPMMNVVVVIGRVKVGEIIARRVRTVSEIVGGEEESEKLVLNTVYEWNGEQTKETASESNMLRRISNASNVSMGSLLEELRRRQEILNWMARKNIRSFNEVAEIVRRYYTNPDRIYGRARLDI